MKALSNSIFAVLVALTIQSANPPGACADNYEQNDSPWQAYDVTAYDNVLLSNVAGPAVMEPNDEDWYRFETGPEDQVLVVVCYFEHAQGDIDIFLYDGALNPLAYSYSVTDNERIDLPGLVPGTYYIRVVLYNDGKPGNNEYELAWAAGCRDDDAYEQNDTPWGAYDLSAYPDTWLSDLAGPAVMGDAIDYYQFQLAAGGDLEIDCAYNTTNGDLYMLLFNEALQVAAIGVPSPFGLKVTGENVTPGLYRVAVIPVGRDPQCTSYDLNWYLVERGSSSSGRPGRPVPRPRPF